MGSNPSSTGLGKEVLNAGDRQWGKTMHTDLLDAMEWAITKEIADPKRIAIMGFSYGGYATLAGLAFTPDIFKCGVSIFGPADVNAQIANFLSFAPAYKSGWKQRMGDVDTARGREALGEVSQIHFVDQIKRPLLVAHGANDKFVNKSESERVVVALRKSSIPVT